MTDDPDLGPCCICETHFGVTNIVMLNQRCLVPGHGWGCFECGLPMDGAVIVLCDGCMELYEAGEPGGAALFACRGYPGSDGRVPFNELPPGEFEHDITKHMPAHDWIPSTLGHGKFMCARCKVTDREAAATGMEECEA